MRVKVLQTKAYLHLHVYIPYPNTCIRVQYEGILLNMAQIQVSAIHWSTMILAFWYLPNSLPYFKVIWKSIFSNLKNGKKKKLAVQLVFLPSPMIFVFHCVCNTDWSRQSQQSVKSQQWNPVTPTATTASIKSLQRHTTKSVSDKSSHPFIKLLLKQPITALNLCVDFFFFKS